MFKGISRAKLMRTDMLTDGRILKQFVCPLHASAQRFSEIWLDQASPSSYTRRMNRRTHCQCEIQRFLDEIKESMFEIPEYPCCMLFW